MFLCPNFGCNLMGVDLLQFLGIWLTKATAEELLSLTKTKPYVYDYNFQGGGRGGDTFRTPPKNNFCLYSPPVLRCFWKRPLMTPTTALQASFTATPSPSTSPSTNPPPPPLKILIIHHTLQVGIDNSESEMTCKNFNTTLVYLQLTPNNYIQDIASLLPACSGM